jgi:hypothetical protein
MIQSRRRRRHGSQGLPSPSSPKMMKVIGIFVVMLFAIWGVSTLFATFSPSSRGVRVATILHTDSRGNVMVTLSGEGTPQRAESGLRLYDGDRVQTEGNSSALLQFFDGTVVSLGGGSSLHLRQVLEGESSSIDLELGAGRLWVAAGTGTTVARTIRTPMGTHHNIPANTRAIVGSEQGVGSDQDDLYVFASSGPGIVSDFGVSEVITGEGQELHVTAGLLRQKSVDLYGLRSVLDERIFSSAFYLSSQRVYQEPLKIAEKSKEVTVDGTLLVVDAPLDESTIEGSAVTVSGRVGPRVTTVRVNGYSADLPGDGSFTKELALPPEENFSVEVQAEDKDGLIVAEKSLALRHDIFPPESPTITFPPVREDGGPVPMQQDEFEIIGSASSEAAGIIVNGYQLQKFKPGNPWKYLVDPAIGNVRIGENSYEIVAVDRAGNKSEPVVLSILWKAQALTLATTGEGNTGDRNAYRAPGSLRVVAPTDGSPYTTSDLEVLIEGETHADTASISINGYNLSKYLSGKTTWNYIARAAFSNYRDGINRYTVVSRNAEGKILDVLLYVIEKE